MQIIGRDLMAESATPAVKHDDDLLGSIEAERAREARIVDAVGVQYLDLEVVVAGAERAELPIAALDGPLTHAVGICQLEAAAGLRVISGTARDRASGRPRGGWRELPGTATFFLWRRAVRMTWPPASTP